MRRRHLGEVALPLLLTGCLVTCRDFPTATLASIPHDREPKPLSYHVEPMSF